jgi:hypothetical protein
MKDILIAAIASMPGLIGAIVKILKYVDNRRKNKEKPP